MPSPEPFSMYSPPGKAGTHNILLLGEAPGEEEEKQGKPFVGASGEFLNDTLRLAGIDRSECHVTNVFATRPPANDLKAWTLTKTELRKLGFSEVGRLPQINKRYLHPDREHEVSRLRSELQHIKPDLIICLGGTAMWALTGDSRVTTNRGTFFPTDWGCAIGTFHPAMVLRAWENRPIVWADLTKARRFLDGTLPPPQKRRICINPTEEELEYCYERFLVGRDLLGVDIETAPGCDQITTFAIGTDAEGVCIPLWDKNTLPAMCQVYDSPSSEALRWRWIERFCALPNPKVLQNGLYDMQYLLDVLDIRPVNVLHDTAILQHSLQPELPKDLGTLASLFLNEPSWKFMRESAKDAKADE